MANTLGVYDPIFYAQEALENLEKSLGIASRIHRGFDAERRTFRRGQVVSIRRPSTFTVNNAPSTAQDLDTGTVNITLDRWKEVKFKLSDQELAYTEEQIIDEHIRPAAYAIADEIDTHLAGHSFEFPAVKYDAGSATAVADLLGARKLMRDNAVNLEDAGRLHYMVGASTEEDLLNLSAFTQHQGSGSSGVEAQRRGSIGFRYGFDFFTNQNAKTQTAHGLSTTSILVNGALAKGATTGNFDAGTLTGSITPGTTFTVVGSSRTYVVTNTVAASSNALASVTFAPGLDAAIADNAAVTVEAIPTKLNTNLAFHRNSMALAMARLPDMGRWRNTLGAQIASVQDPKTGLAVRSRVYYVGNSSEVHVALDVLYGSVVLNHDMAARQQAA